MAADIDTKNDSARALGRDGRLGLPGYETVEESFGGSGMGVCRAYRRGEEIRGSFCSVSLSYGAHSNPVLNSKIRLNGYPEQ